MSALGSVLSLMESICMRTLIIQPSIKVCSVSVSTLHGHPEPSKTRSPDNFPSAQIPAGSKIRCASVGVRRESWRQLKLVVQSCQFKLYFILKDLIGVLVAQWSRIWVPASTVFSMFYKQSHPLCIKFSVFSKETGTYYFVCNIFVDKSSVLCGFE